MTYDIFKRTTPAMPKPGKGTKFIGFILLKASKDMREVLVPMVMPALSAHLTEVQFQYSDNKNYEMSGQMGHLIGLSGVGKVQFTHLVEAMMRSFRQHDETEFKKLTDWQQKNSGWAAEKYRLGSKKNPVGLQRPPRIESHGPPTGWRVTAPDKKRHPALRTLQCHPHSLLMRKFAPRLRTRNLRANLRVIIHVMVSNANAKRIT